MTSDEPKKEKKLLVPDGKGLLGKIDIPPITIYAMRLERAVLRVWDAWNHAIVAVDEKKDSDAALDKVNVEIKRLFGIVQHHHRQKREGGA